MSIFKYDNQYKTQVAKVDGILLCCQEVKDGCEQKAIELAAAYKSRLMPLAEFILKETSLLYGKMKPEDLMRSLGTPMIDLDRHIVSYLEPSLDHEHIIEVEFGGLFDRFFRVSVDG